MHRAVGVDTLASDTSSYRQSGETDLSQSEQYRRYARKCLEMADEATDRSVQAVMIHMAQVWVRLAQNHEAAHKAASDAEHEAPAE